jgi:hypothetical protein
MGGVDEKLHCKTSASIASSKCITVDLMLLQSGISLFNNTKAVFDETQGLLIRQSECIN